VASAESTTALDCDVCMLPQHTVALTADEVITWGRNDQGQCGQGERAEVTWVKPRFIRMLSRALVTQVVCGSHHTLCVTATSQVPSRRRRQNCPWTPPVVTTSS